VKGKVKGAQPATRAHCWPSDSARWARVTRIPHEGKTPPIQVNTNKHERFVRTLIHHMGPLEAAARPLLAQAAKDNFIIAMAVTQGDLDTLINFACSIRRRGIEVTNVVVFSGDEVVQNVARALGFYSLYHPAFGDLPKPHAVQ
jgi:hypothetical protein